jgi:hypothetical protein
MQPGIDRIYKFDLNKMILGEKGVPETGQRGKRKTRWCRRVKKNAAFQGGIFM